MATTLCGRECSCTVQITREAAANGVFVPKSAVFNDQTTQSYRVFVIQDGVAKLAVVQLGTEESGFYQILAGVEARRNRRDQQSRSVIRRSGCKFVKVGSSRLRHFRT